MNFKKERLQRKQELKSSSYKRNLWNYLRNNNDQSYVYIDGKKLIRQAAPFLDDESYKYFKDRKKTRVFLEK